MRPFFDYRIGFGYTSNMKLTLQLQLLPTRQQKKDLLDTMERFNQAATYAAEVGFRDKVFGQVSLHRRAYYDIREKFGLSSQMAIRAIAKAVECFQRNKSKCPKFKPRGAICYDQRVLSFKGLTEVSLWALTGRLRIPFVCGAYQKHRQGRIKGQADLIYRNRKFYLLCTIEMPDGAPLEPTDVLGVDLGIVNIATDSTGETFSGDAVEANRVKYATRRAVLQSVGTKSAKRRLVKIRRKESNFKRNTNHVISKRLVGKAKASRSAIVLENLKGIRKGTTVRRSQRAKFSSWAFFQLRSFIEYKAKLAGVLVMLVDPRNTSRTCPKCGHCEKGNRKSQSEFACKHCGYSANADFVAAVNIRSKGLVKGPMVGAVEGKTGLLLDCA